MIKKNTEKQKKALKTTINREHEQATQKAQDLNHIRQKEIEFQNLKRENAQKNAELEQLREKLLMKNTQINSQSTRPQVQVGNVYQNNRPQMSNNQPVNQSVPPMVQRMMMARQQQLQQQQLQQYGIANDTTITNKIDNLKAQTEYMEELDKIKKLRAEEEKRAKKQESDTSSESSESSKSSVEYNVNLKTILSDSKKNLQDVNSSEKITSLGVVDIDEVSRSNISLGKKRVKKDKESKDSIKSDKPKNVRQKKTGITLN